MPSHLANDRQPRTDHEPPIRIVTQLAEDGIHWAAGSEVKTFDHKTQQLDLIHLDDEVDVDIDSFNHRVVTESFNRVVCAELAKHIDPNLPGKTLVFAATDLHADMLVRLLQATDRGDLGPRWCRSVALWSAHEPVWPEPGGRGRGRPRRGGRVPPQGRARCPHPPRGSGPGCAGLVCWPSRERCTFPAC